MNPIEEAIERSGGNEVVHPSDPRHPEYVAKYHPKLPKAPENRSEAERIENKCLCELGMIEEHKKEQHDEKFLWELANKVKRLLPRDVVISLDVVDTVLLDALSSAQEKGRREGLEIAAKTVERHAERMLDLGIRELICYPEIVQAVINQQ